MSKMKHLLRKLHIGGGGADNFADHHRVEASSSVSASPTPQTTPVAAETAAYSALTSGESAAEEAYFEEEYQMQLALAISVSDPETREDAETAQIKAAKQRSLGLSGSESVVEFLSVRYWSNNVVNYDEKVMNGFYDIYGGSSNLTTQGKMPSLVDLEAIPVSDSVDYEVILVDRANDIELRKLEEKVVGLLLDYQALGAGQIMNGLVQIIADIVVDRMGGPVSNADEMLKRWTSRSYEVRNSLKSVVIPIGCLEVGLSRHRALLFKVLADRINLPCMLIKGSYYTGTDDGAVNLIKIDDGSEYIIDLMGAPGTLIPAEVPSCNLQNFGLDTRSYTDISDTVIGHERVVTASSSNSVTASSEGIPSKKDDKNVGDKNQMERFEYDFGKLLPSLCKSNEGLSSGGEKPSAAKKLQVKDVSKYVISAAKNPDFAQKLHAVLLENGASPSSDMFSNTNPQYLGEDNMLAKCNIYDGNMADWGAQCDHTFLRNSEQCLVPFTGAQLFENVSYDTEQNVIKRPQTAQEELNFPNTDFMLPLFAANKEGSVPNYSETTTNFSTHDANAVGSSQLVASVLQADHTSVSSLSRAYNPINGQPRDALVGNDALCSKESTADVSENIEKQEETCMQLITKSNGDQNISCNTYNEKSSPVLGEVAEWEIPWEDLQVFERIGIGSYGEVFRAEWNSTEVAVKRFMNQDISGDALDQFKCEVEIMLRLRHPNVVLFMGAVTRPPNLSILTEFLPRGSLFKLLHRPNIQLDEKRRLRMALDVAKGMNYLHTSNPMIVHRDLKTLNLLVDKNWVVKVCDFGMSRLLHHTFLSSTSTAGTPEWMAPEVLRNELSNEKCDVYSFGVILWELATLRVPWNEMNSMQVVGAVGFQHRHLDVPDWVDPLVTELILECWNPVAQLRPSFGQIIARLRCFQHLVIAEKRKAGKVSGRNERKNSVE
ncbi:hypothetical protein ACET3Z_004230 [Daucus carota]